MNLKIVTESSNPITYPKGYWLPSMKLLVSLLLPTLAASQAFTRIATFNTCKQLDADCNVDDETVAEIVDASTDGNTLVYTDGELQQLGKEDT